MTQTEMATMLAGALDQVFGFEAQVENERKRAEIEEQKALMEARTEAVSLVSNWVQNICSARASKLIVEVQQFYNEASDKMWESLERSPSMPRMINFEERYAAFGTIGDREKLLERIDQTLNAAKDAIERAESLTQEQIQGALLEGVSEFHKEIEPLTQIKVRGIPTEQDEQRMAQQLASYLIKKFKKSHDAKEKRFASIQNVIESTFISSLTGDEAKSPLRDSEVEDFKRSLHGAKDHEDQTDDYVSAAVSAADAACDALFEQSKAYAGKPLIKSDLPDFQGEISVSREYDPKAVLAFYNEVRHSFETYKKCIMDNGVFSALPSTPRFGVTVSTHWFWRFEEMTNTQRKLDRIIPCTIEGADKDDLVQATERLHKLNEKPYLGLLESNIEPYVDAFWFGYKKLAEFTNGIIQIKASQLDSYLMKLKNKIYTDVSDLGYFLSDSQVDNLCKQIKKIPTE
ncbi:hypothetical protein [Anaerotardibacter muris]|uniref:hypothetical protein n=1 Tax=Anaerotardibacter muris TaxID=2941505 RepID=UPI0020416A0A|nr:hypothetical protein [Anaerotardibacter muris]